MFFGLSAIQCFVAIVIIFLIIYWLTPRKSAWFSFLVVTVLLAVLAYNFVPNETDDLTRYYSQINYLRDYGYDYLQRCFNEGINDWDVYRVCGYYFYFISKLPSNSYLPAITIFLAYGLMFLVIYKIANKFNVSKAYLFLGSMFFLSTYWFYDTASGIRNGLVFSVIFACAYYMLAEKKHTLLCLLGLILSCFMHSAGIILVAFVFLTYLTVNVSGKFLNLLLVFGLALGGVLIEYLSEITDNEFIQSIAGKAERHVDGGGLDTGTMFLVNVATFAVVALVMLFASYYISRKNDNRNFNNFFKFSTYIMFFMIGSLFSSLVFVRIARWVLPAMGCIYFMTGMQLQNDQFSIEKEETDLTVRKTGLVMGKRIRALLLILYVLYTGVHFWYLCTGSSLNWMHF